MRRAISVHIIFAFILLLNLTGCGTGNDDNAGAEASVEDVIRGASERLQATESLYFELDIDGDSFIDPEQTLQLLNAEGQLQRPDEVAVTFQVQALGTATLSIRMITLGEDAWTTNPVTGNWESAPEEFGYNPSILFDDEIGLTAVLEGLPDAEIETIEEINGQESYKVVGTVAEEDIGPITSDTITGGDATLNAWIDAEDSRIHRVDVIESEDAEAGEPATWVMELSQHDEQITIEPPE